jgi:hypothetical protein
MKPETAYKVQITLKEIDRVRNAIKNIQASSYSRLPGGEKYFEFIVKDSKIVVPMQLIMSYLENELKILNEELEKL